MDDNREAALRRRSVVRVTTLAEQGTETDLATMTVEQRLAMMWPLALDAWAFMGKPVEPRLPRHIVRVLRR